jgi:hypothetical protein
VFKPSIKFVPFTKTKIQKTVKTIDIKFICKKSFKKFILRSIIFKLKNITKGKITIICNKILIFGETNILASDKTPIIKNKKIKKFKKKKLLSKNREKKIIIPPHNGGPQKVLVLL